MLKNSSENAEKIIGNRIKAMFRPTMSVIGWEATEDEHETTVRVLRKDYIENLRDVS